MNWFKLECTTRAFVTALQLTVRYEMSVIIIIIIINVTSLLRHSLLINMPYTKEDKLSIKLLRQEKGWGAKHICKEFSYRNWAVSSVRDLLRKIDTTNSISLRRPVADGRRLSERNRISSV